MFLQKTKSRYFPTSISNHVYNIIVDKYFNIGIFYFQFVLTRGTSGYGFTVTGCSPVEVGRVDHGSSAYKAGLFAGDFIVRINRQNVSRSRAQSVAKLVRCADQQLTIHIQRPFNNNDSNATCSSGIDVNSDNIDTTHSSITCQEGSVMAPKTPTTPRQLPRRPCHLVRTPITEKSKLTVSARSPLGEITNSPTWRRCMRSSTQSKRIAAWNPSSDLGDSLKDSDIYYSVCSDDEDISCSPLNTAYNGDSSFCVTDSEEDYTTSTNEKSSTFYEETLQLSDGERQAAIYTLWRCEAEFVQAMSSGAQRFSRPLRHCIITANEHKALFQNAEKVNGVINKWYTINC